jgi:hypothetical protein
MKLANPLLVISDLELVLPERHRSSANRLGDKYCGSIRLFFGNGISLMNKMAWYCEHLRRFKCSAN